MKVANRVFSMLLVLTIFSTLFFQSCKDSKDLHKKYGFNDTLTVIIFIEDREVLEIEIEKQYPNFKMISAKELASGAYKWSNKIGSIYEIMIIKDLNSL